MAKNSISDIQLNALFAKGHISPDFYNSLAAKDPEDRSKSLELEGKQAEKEYLAENTVAKTTASDATDTGKAPAPKQFSWNAPGYENAPAAPRKGLFSTPAVPVEEQGAVSKWISQEAVPAVKKAFSSPDPIFQVPGTSIGAPNVVQMAPVTVQAGGDGVDPSQIVGGKKAEVIPPGAFDVPRPPAKAPSGLQMPQAAGTANPFSGPTDFEKFTTPAERARKTQLVEEEKLFGDIAGRKADIQMKEEGQIADIASRQAQEYQAMVEHQAAIREKEQENVLLHNQMLMNESADLAKKKVDPNRAFAEMPTANKVFGVIGLLFGIGSTRKGGQNPALESINKTIDRDIAAQEFDIKNQGATIDQRRGILQDRMRQFGNNDLARLAAKKDYLDVVEMQAKSVVAGNASDKTRVQLDEFLAGLQAQKDKVMNDFNMQNDQRSRALAAAQVAAQAGVNAKLYEEHKARRDFGFKVNEDRIKAGLPPLDPGQLAGIKPYDYQASDPKNMKDIQERAVTLNTDPWTGQPLPKPMQFMAKDADDSKKIKESQEAFDTMMNSVNKIQQLRTQFGGGTVDRNAVAVAKVYRQQVIGAVKKMDSLGTLDAGVERFVNPLIPEDPMEYSPLGSTDKQIDAFKSSIQQEFQSKLKTRLTPSSAAALPKSPEQLGFKENK